MLRELLLVPSLMVTGSRAKVVTVVIHILVWSLLTYVLFVYPPLVGTGVKLPKQFLIKQIIHMLLMVTTYYLNTYYLVPKFLLKGRLIPFTLSIALIMIFASLLMARIEVWFELSEHLRRAFGKKIWHNSYVDFFGLFTTIFVFGISTSLSIMQQWNRDWKIRQELETQRAVAELAFLKAQINPHFFFNTLNSIYALTYINAETSRQVLLKLSSMMRYLLYETQHDTTPISKELTFIRNYVEIMKLRLNDNMFVDLILPEETSEMPIAPMVLLPFIENAFKHGVNDQNTGSISVNITQLNDGLDLKVKNNVINKTDETDIDGKGIGLTNTRRRLNLLYENRYSLEIKNDELLKEYYVHLQIALL